MKPENPREVLARADEARRTAHAADMARVRIRLGEKPVQRGGLLGFLKSDPAGQDIFFDGAETGAIYEALGIVMRDANARADEIEARLSVKDGVQ